MALGTRDRVGAGLGILARGPGLHRLGAVWAGDFGQTPPDRLDAIIDTTPVWNPIVKALEYLEPGGRLVINAIRKEDRDKEALLDLQYPTHLWMERKSRASPMLPERTSRNS